jgi:serine transporter
MDGSEVRRMAHFPSPSPAPIPPPVTSRAGIAGFSDISWMLALFGTAVGAGILYLPLQAGTASLWALLGLAVLIFPVLYLAHRLVLELLLLGDGELDYTGAAGRYLGRGLGWVVLLVFLLTLQVVLVSYAIGLNASLGDFLHQYGWTARDWSHGPYLSLGILLGFALIYLVGQRLLLRLMTLASGLLIIALLGVSLYLIPFWDLSRFAAPVTAPELIDDMLLVLPILAFSLMFFPTMSSMVMALKAAHPGWPVGAEVRLGRVVLITSGLLMLFVVFFVLSIVLSLSPEEFALATRANLNGLSMLSRKAGVSPALAEIGTLLGLCALFTSFAGVFLAVRDSARELTRRLPGQGLADASATITHRWSEWVLLALVLGSAWLITIANPSIVKAFGVLITPLVGIFIFFLPLVVLIRARGWAILRKPGHLVVLLFGVLILFSYDLGTWLKDALS